MELVGILRSLCQGKGDAKPNEGILLPQPEVTKQLPFQAHRLEQMYVVSCNYKEAGE